jgi:hypothetical protein
MDQAPATLPSNAAVDRHCQRGREKEDDDSRNDDPRHAEDEAVEDGAPTIVQNGFLRCSGGGGGDPDRIRTCGPQIRNLMLYPAELRGRAAFRRR